MQFIETGVLVIGGGGAAGMAAIEASKKANYVTIAVKGKFGKSGATPMALGAAAAVGPWHHPDDSKELHLKDTVKGGVFLNEDKLVRALVNDAGDRMMDLEKYGAYWERAEKGTNYVLRIDGGHSFPRSPYIEDRPGLEMMRAMKGEIARRNIPLVEDVMITKLLTNGERVIGATGVNTLTGEPVVFRAKATVIATGGAGEVYPLNTQDVRNTGDGYAIALYAGAALLGMEFVQFYPIGLVAPKSVKGILAAAPYYVHLLNKDGRRFMEDYDPRLELATRDIVSRSVYQEIVQGRGTPSGGVYADMTYHPPGFMKRQMPGLYEQYLKWGIDTEKDMIEIAPTVHFFMGGIRVDENWAATVPGLYAAGEAAGGVHGANRLSQNSLADILVSGYRAGKAAGIYARRTPVADPSYRQIQAEFTRVYDVLAPKDTKGPRPFQLRSALKDTMWSKAGLIRDEAGLLQGANEIRRLMAEDLPKTVVTSSSRIANREWIEALENYNLLKVAESIVQSALCRTESRGAHYRRDHPRRDDENWLKHVVVTEKEGSMNISPAELDRCAVGEE